MSTRPSAIHRIRRSLVILAALVALSAAAFYTYLEIENRPAAPRRQPTDPVPVVSVLAVSAATHRARLQGDGEARPRYELSLATEVAGRLASVSPLLESGFRANVGSVLATVDPVPYEQAVAAAEQSLAQAKVELLQEQREAERAQDEWHRAELGAGSASPLLLRKPQLAAAEALLKQAQAMLKQARQDLARTHITTPFNAIIVERHVAPGQYVQTGDAIATLYSSDRMDVRISIPSRQWSLLPSAEQLLGHQPVTLSSTSGEQWQGVVSRVEQHVDSNSRQRSLVVSVEHPLRRTPPLLPGTFLHAEFSGADKGALLAIPASSLTAGGDVWYVNAANRLARFDAEVVFQQGGTLFANAPAALSDHETAAPLRILTMPLPAYVPGQEVEPRSLPEGLAGGLPSHVPEPEAKPRPVDQEAL